MCWGEGGGAPGSEVEVWGGKPPENTEPIGWEAQPKCAHKNADPSGSGMHRGPAPGLLIGFEMAGT